MRAVLIIIGVLVVLAGAALIALLVYSETIQADQGEVRIELEDNFPQ